MLGDRCCRVGGLDALHRRAVGRRDHDHRAFAALRSKLMLDELPHLTSALADEPDDHHVRVGTADDVGQQGGFADAGFAENPDALSACAGDKTIDGTDTKLNWIADDAPTERLRWCSGNRTGRNADRKRFAVDRVPQCIDDAAEQAFSDRGQQLAAGGNHLGQAGKAEQIADRGQHCDVVEEPDHLGHDASAGGRVDQMAQFADARLGRGGMDDDAQQAADTPLARSWCAVAHLLVQARQDGGETVVDTEALGGHGVPPRQTAPIAAAMAASCVWTLASTTARSLAMIHAVGSRDGLPSIDTSIRLLRPRRANSLETLSTTSG